MKKTRAQTQRGGNEEDHGKISLSLSIRRVVVSLDDFRLTLLVAPPSPERDAANNLLDKAAPHIEAAVRLAKIALKKAGGR